MTLAPKFLIVAFAASFAAGCAATNVAEKPSLLGAPPTESEALAEASVDPAQPTLAPAEDDLTQGKKHYRIGDFGLAEKNFRAAVERQPANAEAWLGLAASYDQLRRFELADRAYGEALRLAGPTVEVINNQGYSYILRGDLKTARAKLALAQSKAPDNPYVKSNLQLLAARSGPKFGNNAAAKTGESGTRSALAQ
jgi:Flp pilus assembly protein TadD